MIPRQNDNNRSIMHSRIALVIRLILGAVFIFAGVPKIIDTAGFASAVNNYQLLPDALINFFAIFLPWLEVVVGVFLILGVWLPGAVIIYNGLMLTFMAALVISAVRGLDISCGCFSTDSADAIDWKTIARDIPLLLMSLYLLFAVFVKNITNRRRSPKKTATCRPNRRT